VPLALSDLQPLFPTLDVTLPEEKQGECGKNAAFYADALGNHTMWAMRGKIFHS